MDENNNIIIYQSEDGKTHFEVKLERIRCGLRNNKWLICIKLLEVM